MTRQVMDLSTHFSNHILLFIYLFFLFSLRYVWLEWLWGGCNTKLEKIKEKMLGRGLWLGGRRERKLVRPECFLSIPIKTQSSWIGEIIGVQTRSKAPVLLDKITPATAATFFFTFWLFFFLLGVRMFIFSSILVGFYFYFYLFFVFCFKENGFGLISCSFFLKF